MSYVIDGLEYEAEVKKGSTLEPFTLYVTLLPVDRPREYGESYALWKTEEGWEYVGATKMRVSGEQPYGWILDTREQRCIDLLAEIAERYMAGTMNQFKRPAYKFGEPEQAFKREQ